MPTYEYECDACGHTLEAFQSMSDKPLRKCPKCGKLKLQRLIGAGAGIIFKGSGFYETDYKRKSPPAGESASDGKSGDTSSGSSGDKSAAKESTSAKPTAPSTSTKSGDTPQQSHAGTKIK